MSLRRNPGCGGNVAGVVTFAAHDALGRAVHTERSPTNGTVRTPVARMEYNGLGDLVRLQTYTNGTDVVVETYEYDSYGNRIVATDALGNTIHKSYDPLGNVIAESGATYPIRQEFDTQGRRVALYTTRDGIVWDVTRWTYDAATGLCTSKTYADGSVVAYTHTPDGLSLRTTYASGRWVENVYDARRQIVGTFSSDGANDTTLWRDVYGRETSAANGNASYAYALDRCGVATNGTSAIGGIVRTFRRTVDDQGRLSSFGMDGGYAAQTINYRADGRIGSISNVDAVVTYSYSEDGYDLGYSLALVGGTVFTRTLTRDPYRRELVLNVANSAGGNFAYSYDALSRPVARNDDTFAYNNRSEVVSSRRGAENAEAYSYDEIGNLLYASFNFVANTYAANNLNQYMSILRASASPRETNPSYDVDGSLTAYGPWSYTYDSANHLATVSSNGVLLVTNFYDAKSRRVRKVTSETTTTFFYDDWNLVEEHIAYTNGTISTIHYYWGKDLSGTLQGAGGVSGLLYLTVDGAVYIPCYDNNGNITRYVDVNGITVAAYTYDAFGRTISQSGLLADVFRHRFSTKYFDALVNLYYYDSRFYSPLLTRWLSRDVMEEQGGYNLYQFVKNNAYYYIDIKGRFPSHNWNTRVDHDGKYSDAVWDFFSNNGPLTYVYRYPDSATRRLLDHPSISPIWNEFLLQTCQESRSLKNIHYKISFTATKSDFIKDMLNAVGLFQLGNIKEHDFGYQVLGSFTGQALLIVDCRNCIKQLKMDIHNAMTTASLTRNPFSRKPFITYPYFNPVITDFYYDVEERIR